MTKLKELPAAAASSADEGASVAKPKIKDLEGQVEA